MRNEKTIKSNNKISVHSRKPKNSEAKTTERLFAGLVTLGVSEIFYAASGSLSNENEYSDAIAYAKKKRANPKIHLSTAK